MIEVYSDAKYSDGQTVNSVLNELQNKYRFLDNFESYVMNNMYRFTTRYKQDFPLGKLDNFLSKLFKEYIVSRSHGLRYKPSGYLEFINTGLLITTTRIAYFEDNF